MGKEKGFLEYHRQENKRRAVAERVKDFAELYEEQPVDVRRQQAAVCMNCGVPFCQSGMVLSGMMTGCPLHNLIPEWNDALCHGNDRHAFERLIKTNPFPEFTGRVCPALCEKACMCGQYETPVTIHDNEKYLIEQAFEKGYLTPRTPQNRSNKRIAVIGSGPAGLSCADYLNRRGHHVTVYEREDEIGGLLMYGIPYMKLDKRVITRRRRLMEAEGVTFQCGVNVGEDISEKQLMDGYDAVLLCCGAKKARRLGIDGETDIKGVYPAVEFLSATTRALVAAESLSLAEIKEDKYISAKDKHVVIVGGGDTGNDCIGTAIRHGAKSVLAVEMMPKPPEQRTPDNPWPEWDRSLKTDYGHEEAIAVFGSDVRRFLTTVTGLRADEKGVLQAVTLCDVKMENGRPCADETSAKEIPCNLLLVAAGFVGCEDAIAETLHLKRTVRGNIKTRENGYRIGDTKMFCAGDMHIGQSLVVRAIAEGLAAAKEVDAFLMGYVA